jgi:hypothetical protein
MNSYMNKFKLLFPAVAFGLLMSAGPVLAVGISIGWPGALNLNASENLYYGNSAAAPSPLANLLLLQVNTSEKFRVDTNGNVFINGSQICTATGCAASPGGGDNLGNHTATGILNMNSFQIQNMAEPSLSTDATTKNYVDTLVATGGGGLWQDDGPESAAGEIYYSGGNIGIGTNNPFGLFHVVGNDATIFNPSDGNAQELVGVTLAAQNANNTVQSFSQILLRNAVSGVGDVRLASVRQAGSHSDFVITTESGFGTASEKFRIAGNGNIKASGKTAFDGYTVDTSISVTAPSAFFSNQLIGLTNPDSISDLAEGDISLGGGANSIRLSGLGVRQATISVLDGNGRLNIFNNAEDTATGANYLRGGEEASWIRMDEDGTGISFHTAPAGIAGNSISWAQQMQIARTGVSIGGQAICLADGTNCPAASGSDGYIGDAQTHWAGGNLQMGNNTIFAVSSIDADTIYSQSLAEVYVNDSFRVGSDLVVDGNSLTVNGTEVCLADGTNCSGSGVGDITGVTAGSGLTGGGSTGAVTLNVGAGTGITVAADTVSANNTSAIWNANQFQGRAVSSAVPSEGQVLVYTSGSWQPSSVSGGGGDNLGNHNAIANLNMGTHDILVDNLYSNTLNYVFIEDSLVVQASAYLDDDTSLGGVNDDWIKFSGFLEMHSNTDSYGIVLRDKDTSNYLGLTQIDGSSYLADTSGATNYFLRGDGRDITLGGYITSNFDNVWINKNLRLPNGGYIDNDATTPTGSGDTDNWIRLSPDGSQYIEMSSANSLYGTILYGPGSSGYLNMAQVSGTSYFSESSQNGNFFLKGVDRNVTIGNNLTVQGASSVSGNSTVTGSLTSGSASVTNSITVGGGASVTGSISANYINSATDLVAGDDLSAGDDVFITDDLVANENNWGTCGWTGWSSTGATCPSGRFMAGVDVGNGLAFAEERVYCCEL